MQLTPLEDTARGHACSVNLPCSVTLACGSGPLVMGFSGDSQTMTAIALAAETLTALVEEIVSAVGGTWTCLPSGSPTLPGVLPGSGTLPGGWLSGLFPSAASSYASSVFATDAPGLAAVSEETLTIIAIGED